jgi:sugar phosphate isomerase/epimerase
MRLGVVGMLPSDLAMIQAEHLEAVRQLDLTGVSIGQGREQLFDVDLSACSRLRSLCATMDMDLVQFNVGYAECLFHPAKDVRKRAFETIERGIEVGCAVGAHACLIRPGSMGDSPYAVSMQNMLPDCRDRLVETLRDVAVKAESEGAVVVVETHAVTVMDSPETNRDILQQVGSDSIGVVMDFVNHFQSLEQVYNSTERLKHIYAVMGGFAPVGHCKDIKFGPGLVIHIDEEVPGEGVLDMETALRCWHDLYPNGYMLLEHLPDELYPKASANVHRIATEAMIEIH